MENLSINLPAIALRGLTAFPSQQISFEVEREASIYALNNAMEGDRKVFLVTQKEISTLNPEGDDLYKIGTICRIAHIIKTGDKTIRVHVEGETRAKLHRLWQQKPYLMANIEILSDAPSKQGKRVEALLRQTYSLVSDYSALLSSFPEEYLSYVLDEKDPSKLADYIANNLTFKYEDKQAVLQELNPTKRLDLINSILAHEIEIIRLEIDIEEKVRQRVNQMQKDTVLREQVKVIQHELGEDDNEIEAYEEKIWSLNLEEDVEDKLIKDVHRLSKQPFGSSEGTVIRNYLDTCLEIPWNTYTEDRLDIKKTRAILDKDHYGLTKVKESILEFLAVKQLNPDSKGKILCLVGPPGVGKTSIAMSIAHAMNRKLSRISLGGIRDEAEIRGHRKTYIGSMPGRIIEAIIRSKSMNPVLVLDEIDKLSSDVRGDPASALLEVLDAEQNSTFRDHFIEIPIDLSKVMFITTANTTDSIPRPLLDRMEVISLSSYTDEEKLHIAKNHLIKKQLKEHGITGNQLRFTDDGIRKIIANYAKESGVRILERNIGKICAKTAILFIDNPTSRITITAKNVSEYLGPEKYLESIHSNEETVGIVNGLAWTEHGGEILEVEVNTMEGTGKLELTGNLGTVMQESAKTALSYLRSQSKIYNLPENFYKNMDIHIHFPEGATPKDGPSAGIAITTAIYSALTGLKIRKNIAMTGEITLRGRVLPIGGLKEKTMAALRNGIQTVIIPFDNVRDLEEIDPDVREKLHFISAKTYDDVAQFAILNDNVVELNEHGFLPVNSILKEGSYVSQLQ